MKRAYPIITGRSGPKQDVLLSAVLMLLTSRS